MHISFESSQASSKYGKASIAARFKMVELPSASNLGITGRMCRRVHWEVQGKYLTAHKNASSSWESPSCPRRAAYGNNVVIALYLNRIASGSWAALVRRDAIELVIVSSCILITSQSSAGFLGCGGKRVTYPLSGVRISPSDIE